MNPSTSVSFSYSARAVPSNTVFRICSERATLVKWQNAATVLALSTLPDSLRPSPTLPDRLRLSPTLSDSLRPSPTPPTLSDSPRRSPNLPDPPRYVCHKHIFAINV